MAQTIVIEQGNKDLENVTKTTPDTRVNQQAVVKYPVGLEPVANAGGSMQGSSWTDEDGVTFTNPHIYGTDPGDDSSEGSDNNS